MTFQITTQDELTYVFWDGTEVCVVGGILPGIIKCLVKKYKVKIKLKGLRLPPVRQDEDALGTPEREQTPPIIHGPVFKEALWT